MTRLIAALCLCLAAAAPLSEADAQAASERPQSFTVQQQAEIDAQIRAYILEHPDVIVEAMQVLEQRQQADARRADKDRLARLDDEIRNDGYSFVGGNPEGDVTLVEFLDYRCPYCQKAHEIVMALLEADRNVRFVVKEFPILGPESTYAARAAMAALRQGDDLYAAFNDAMMRHKGDLSTAAVARLAAEVGLDAERMTTDMEAPEIAENIRRTYALARELEINGTPGFIIGDEIVRGFVPYDTLRELVEDARRNG